MNDLFALVPLVGRLLVLLLFGTVTSVRADLLVYESYNYALSNGTSLDGVATNATGLAGAYDVNGVAVTYQSTGLSFGSDFLPTSGGAARLALNSGQYGITGAALDTVTTGDLYQSFLFNYTTISATGAGSGTFYRTTDSLTGSTNPRLAAAGEATVSGAGPGIGYNGSSSSDMVGTGAGLTASTTYLMLARLTNVGLSLSVGTPGVADFWVFTETGYGNWLSAGGEESSLSTFALMSATDTVTSGTYTFNNSDFLQLAGTTTGTGGGTIDAIYDELRFGTSLADVVAVPEPSAGAVLLLGMLVAGLRRRR